MGGAEGTRTPDPHTASVVRYQLRHSPKLPGRPIKRDPARSRRTDGRQKVSPVVDRSGQLGRSVSQSHC